MRLPRHEVAVVALLLALVIALASSLAILSAYRERHHWTCVKDCQAGGWSPDEGECERLCAEPNP